MYSWRKKPRLSEYRASSKGITASAEVTSSHPDERERVFSFFKYSQKGGVDDGRGFGVGLGWATHDDAADVFALVEQLCTCPAASACTSEVLIVAMQTLAQEQTSSPSLYIYFFLLLRLLSLCSKLVYFLTWVQRTRRGGWGVLGPPDEKGRHHPLSFIKLLARYRAAAAAAPISATIATRRFSSSFSFFCSVCVCYWQTVTVRVRTYVRSCKRYRSSTFYI